MKDIVIRSQILTEKSHKLSETGVYTFFVRKDATKQLIAKNITDIFGAQVKKVRVISVPKKFKSFRGNKGFENGYKKAYVTLLNNGKINFESLKISENV